MTNHYVLKTVTTKQFWNPIVTPNANRRPVFKKIGGAETVVSMVA